MLPTRLLTGLVKPSSAWPRTGATSLPGVVGAPSSLGRFEDDAGGCTAGLACSAAAAASRSTTPAKVRNVRLWPFIDVTLPRKEPRNYVTPALHFAVPILRLRIDRSEDLEVPLTAAPWLDDLGGDDVHEDLRKRTALGVAFEVIGRLVPPEIRVEDHREKEIVAVVDDDDLSAGALDGRVIDQILLSAVRADVALERKLARDDLFDRDLLFPAVAAVALLAARLRHILGAAECTFRFDDIRLSGGHRSPLYSPGRGATGAHRESQSRGSQRSGTAERSARGHACLCGPQPLDTLRGGITPRPPLARRPGYRVTVSRRTAGRYISRT